MDSDDGGDARPTRRFAASPPSRGSQDVESRATARPTRGLAQTFSSLRIRSYLFLWLGMMAMMASVQMQMVARGYLAYDITNSAALLGLVSAGSALPILGLSLVGGAVADRVERKRVIQITQGVNVSDCPDRRRGHLHGQDRVVLPAGSLGLSGRDMGIPDACPPSADSAACRP